MRINRYDPIQYFDQGGSGYGQMILNLDGDFVKFDDLTAPKTNEQLAAICEQIEDKIAFEGMDAAVDYLLGQFEI